VAADNNTGCRSWARGLAPDSLSTVALVGYGAPRRPTATAKRYGGEVLLSRRLTSRLSASLQADYGR
jgi:hypothetical protein